MRRVTDLRPKKIKKEEDTILKPNEDLNLNFLKKDIFFILQGYESRIKIKNKTKRDSNIFKPSYERYLLYTNQKPFSLDIFSFINLETVIIKNSDELNLDLLSSRPLKTLYISNINKIFINKELFIEEIYFKNIKITLKVILKILSSPILKSINFNNVQIITKDDNKTNCIKEINNDLSITQHVMSFTSIDEVRYRDYNSELQNNHISEIISLKIEQNLNLKACSFINSNISLNSLNKILKRFNSFTFVKDSDFLFISYNTSTFNLLETNLDLNLNFIDLKNLERVAVKNFTISKNCDFTDLRTLELQNVTICSKILDEIIFKFPKLSEIGFIGCDFDNNSFYKMIELLKNKIRKLNLKDSLIPLNSLDFLKEKLKNCKVIFRDGDKKYF